MGDLRVLVVLLLVALSASALAKSGSTYYTPDRVANARRNIARYDWARSMRDKVVKAADQFAAQPDHWLWNLPATQGIPRGIHVNRNMGCPKCGHDIDKFGNYPWVIDVFEKPWKITCPGCKETFPKNDFAKFYESGKDENGVFRYEKADRSLLFNADHPDPRDPLHTYGVDDTMGWKDDKGNVYRFIGYYGHYGAWTNTYRALSNMSTAYVYTGDEKYARKAAVALYRIAQLYPEMDYGFWAKLGFENSDGGRGLGGIYGCIWETSLVNSFILAYDAIYPALDDPDVLSALSKQAGKPVTAAEVRALFENDVIRQVHDSILNGRIRGNEGMHQNTMAIAAVVLDEPKTSEDWLDWVFKDGDARRPDQGGNMSGIFKTKVDDDGMGNEASPAYNSLWRNLFRSISDILALYPKYTRNSFINNPKYKKMFQAPVRLGCIGKFSPHIGDTGSTGSPGLASVSAADLVYAFQTFGDAEFAQMAALLNGGSAKGLRGGIFDTEPESVEPRIEAILKERGPCVLKTDNMPSYGCAILRSGAGENARALSLYYGRNIGHGHRDTLNVELFGHGLNLMPDLGYPEYATADCASRFEWTSHTISHNTVTVDQRRQQTNLIGKSNFVVEGSEVSAAEVLSDEAYPQTSLYQRTVAMVDVSDEDFYVVDIFRVKNGKEHLYSLHGAEGEVETEGLNLIAQPKGTLAGEDVEPYVDLGDRKLGAEANGYQYLYDVRRDPKPSDCPSVTYDVVDTWKVLKEPKDIKLRVSLLSPPREVILAHGDPPRNKPGNPRKLTYILLPNQASESTYASVIEPYVGKRTITKIERKDDGDAVTITITTASGRVDTIVSALEPIRTKIGGLDISGRLAIVSEENGKAEAKLIVP